jgi:hypothetical protein
MIKTIPPDRSNHTFRKGALQSLTLERLKKDFPINWEAQRSHFGLSQLAH